MGTEGRRDLTGYKQSLCPIIVIGYHAILSAALAKRQAVD